MNKNVIIGIVVVVILLVLGAWYMNKDAMPGQPVPATPSSTNSAPVSTEEVDAINADAGLDAEFQSVDNDINQL